MNKYIQYLKSFYSSIVKPDVVKTRPIHIQIEPSTYCNLDCPHCPRNEYIENSTHMSLNQFKHIIKAVKPRNVSLNGLGETYLNPDAIKMIKYAKQHDIEISTITNFIAISDEHIDCIVKSGLNLINVSLDSTNKETYIKVRKSDAFERIISNIKKLQAKKKELGLSTPHLRLSFVIEKNNYTEMIAFYEQAKSLGADAVLFQIFNTFDQEKGELFEGVNMKKLEEMLLEISVLEKEYKSPATNIEFLKSRIEEIKNIYNKKVQNSVKKCIMPWVSLYVSVEGDVRYCCIFSAKRFSLGNIYEVDDIMEIYNKKEYQDFRRRLKEGKLPDKVCADCIPESPFDVVKRSKWTPNFIFKK
ncbi:hypothetical protein C0583_03820 [Candidatus Parcubacteria bacterium]|nr:MAG: hypothetical protein C0583_03820 [Candidatus Parcubacteria bacterium]